ncbi:uncharacterized protein N7477_000881 [Penicillium maclennaniae]|uniref:uncharacterized protein n=1 Tax=Penicillium maclennaniae TaxID=1343394 RepID=UPI0025401237|nr:uncharacterized protein N7477_000881 [Penicillium maclennaniae]KAJ5684536.1 hypothetical protein N7477_000881 [Penicillium maclennaniae]
MDISGIALITGAASGIGRACALGLVRDALEKVTSEIQELQRAWGYTKPCRVEIYPTNVADENRVIEVVENVAQKFGRLDYVVIAAGIAMKHIGGEAFAETADWQRILDGQPQWHILYPTSCSQNHSLFALRPLQRGSIVNISSSQGLVGITLSTAYKTSKHPMIGLTRTASEDYADKGLRINAICPGYTETPLTTKSPEILKAMMERVSTAVPMERMGRPEKIADGVLYFSGGRSSFVTGTVECGWWYYLKGKDNHHLLKAANPLAGV